MPIASSPIMRKPIKSYRDLDVYRRAFESAGEIFRISVSWPADEKYSLATQSRKSSRSVCANLGEGWAKKHYPKLFDRHIVDSLGSAEETRVWLDFAFQCRYIEAPLHRKLWEEYGEYCRMLNGLLRAA